MIRPNSSLGIRTYNTGIRTQNNLTKLIISNTYTKYLDQIYHWEYVHKILEYVQKIIRTNLSFRIRTKND